MIDPKHFSNIIRIYNDTLIKANMSEKLIDEEGNQINSGNVEVEVRFVNLQNHEFKRVMNILPDDIESDIMVDDFFELTQIPNPLNRNATETIQFRRTILDNEEEWIRKCKVSNFDYFEYNMRLKISLEQLKPITSFQSQNDDILYEGKKLKYLYRRTKERWTAQFGEYTTLDVTKVTSNRSEISYEVELELDVPSSGITEELLIEFNSNISYIFQVLYGTFKIYTKSEKSDMIRFVNELHGKEGKRSDIYKGIMSEARNLKHKDLVWGGIVGNSITGYTVTDKADGQRYLMIIEDTGIWLAMPGFKYNLVSRINWNNEDSIYRDKLKYLICEGEDIPPDNRIGNAPNSQAWVQLFDLLAINNDISVQKLPHKERLIKLIVIDSLRDIVNEDVLTYKIKSFSAINSPSDFFRASREIIEMSRLYKTDGLIFTPNNEKYNLHRGNLPYNSRILTRYSDVCKWKPIITMDLKIGEDRKLYTVKYLEGRPVEIEFVGNKLTPFDSTNYERKLEKINLDSLIAGTIVEFEWSNNKLVPVKIRDDKDSPNPLHITLDNWKYIHDPITQDTISGRTTNLMRKYHNVIKKRLFDSLPEGSTLLDIASGKGGDVTKWKRFSKVVAVEPNSDHLKILHERVTLNNMLDKVTIIQAMGQDTDKITKAVRDFLGEKADYCSVMLGFSFFWDSESNFNALMKSIIDNTKTSLIFMSIDADIMNQIWNPKLSLTKATNPLKIGDKDYIDYDPRRVPPVKVNIGSIVESQGEYLVYLEDVMRYMKPLFLYRADQESFLNDNEKILSKLYTYGMFDVRDAPEVTEPEVTEPEVTEPEVTEPMDILPQSEMLQFVNNKYDNSLIRIGGNSFMDSYLKGFNPDYQNNSDPSYRANFVNTLKREISDKLASQYNEEFTYWSVIQNSILYYLLTEDILSGNISSSLSNIQYRLNSGGNLSYSDILVIIDIIGVDIIVFNGFKDNIAFYYTTHQEGNDKPIVCLIRISDTDHYDLLAQLINDSIKTLFNSKDPIIQQIFLTNHPDKYIATHPTNELLKAIITIYEDNNKITEKGSIIINLASLPNDDPYASHLKKLFKLSNKGNIIISKTKIEKYKEKLAI